MLGRIFNVKSFSGEKEPSHDSAEAVRILFYEGNAGGTENLLLTGPQRSGKTSLLFQLALSFADEGRHVLYICPRKFTKLPQLLEGRPQPSSVNLSRIQIVYVETREEFLNYMASIHCNASRYFHAIIVDDLDFYSAGLTRNEDLSVIAKIFAYTVDALSFQLQKLGQNAFGVLAVSMTLPNNGQALPHRAVYERWMHHVLSIKESGINDGEFKLSVFEAQWHDTSSLAEVSYSLNEKTFTVQETKHGPGVETQQTLSASNSS